MAHNCWYCGTTEQNKWCEPRRKELEEQKLCFDCNFWLEYAWIQGQKDQVITSNFWHYVIGEEQPKTTPKSCLGYGGAKFYVTFYQPYFCVIPQKPEDGMLYSFTLGVSSFPRAHVVTTTNLWCQGEIPPAFQHLFTPNATVTNDPPTKVGDLT